MADQAPRDVGELLGAQPTVEQLEWALTDTVSLKAEYLRIDLGSQSARMTVQAPSTGDGFIDARVKNVYNIARVGLNVRF